MQSAVESERQAYVYQCEAKERECRKSICLLLLAIKNLPRKMEKSLNNLSKKESETTKFNKQLRERQQ